MVNSRSSGLGEPEAAPGPSEAASAPHPGWLGLGRAGGSQAQSWGLCPPPSLLPEFLPSALHGPDLPEAHARSF